MRTIWALGLAALVWEPWKGSHALPRSGSGGQSPPSPTRPWEPWKGSHALPRWYAPGEAGRLPTRLTGTDTEPARAAAGCRDPARSQPAAAPGQTPDRDRQAERDRLVDRALVGEIRDPRVLAAMRKVLRHRFVPAEQQSRAYDDTPLPIGHGQTISQPFVVAFMTEAARPGPRDRCLEIGTGSGYQAAVLAEVCGAVYSIEYLDLVARTGEQGLRNAGYGPERVHLRVGDGYDGWPEAAPFDVILVTAAPKEVPPPLLDQLAVGGRLVIPVGASVLGQALERWTRLRPGRGPDAFRVEKLLDVRFVPFLGKGARR